MKSENIMPNLLPLTVESFKDDLTAAFKSKFPEANFSIRYTEQLKSLYIVFGVQSPDKWNSNIQNNDPSLHKLFIYGLDEGEFSDTLQLDIAQGGGLIVKPEEGSYYAYGRVKTGLRKKKGSPEQVKKHLVNYFTKLRNTVEANRDNLAHEIV